MLRANWLYRISKAIDKPELRNRVVVFKEYLDRPFDIRRAVVYLVEKDGSNGERWLVNPYYIIPL